MFRTTTSLKNYCKILKISKTMSLFNNNTKSQFSNNMKSLFNNINNNKA